MIREIVNFVESLNEGAFTNNLEPSEGIHLQLWLDEKGGLRKYQKHFYKKGDDLNNGLGDCLRKEILTKWVAPNKPFDQNKKIHSCSPFAMAFKVKSLDVIKPLFKQYFQTAETYCDSENQKKWMNTFQEFCESSLLELIDKVMKEIKEEKKVDKRLKFSENQYIYVYLENVKTEEYRKTHDNYLAVKTFNVDPKPEDEIEGEIFGIPFYGSGYNSKKPFLYHQSATFDINTRVSQKSAIALFKFSQMLSRKQLPNPLPIFIDKFELNNEVVKIFNRNPEEKIGYKEIIRELFKRSADIGNYYLFNFQRGVLKDFDFVSSFRYDLENPIKIENIFKVKSTLNEMVIRNIFDFEFQIVQKIFNNQLVQITRNGVQLKYFYEIENNPKYISAQMFHLVSKYRKSFYDYIYKSKREAVTDTMFHDIILTAILDEIRRDEDHNKSYSIREKLNIWFTLFDYFKQNTHKEEDIKMAEKMYDLKEKITAVANDPSVAITSDEEFAYAAGQLIYYLLNQSETANKTHALLEPFLQKSDGEQLKIAISRTFDRYKHAISFYKGRFENLAAQVLQYRTNVNIKSLLPIILAGYFAESIIY